MVWLWSLDLPTFLSFCLFDVLSLLAPDTSRSVAAPPSLLPRSMFQWSEESAEIRAFQSVTKVGEVTDSALYVNVTYILLSTRVKTIYL